MAVRQEQPIQHEGGVPQNPNVPFNQDLVSRISYVNIFVKEHARKAANQTNEADREYEQYLAEIGDEEKGALLAEGLAYQANPKNDPFFEAKIAPEGSVVFTFQIPSQKPYSTESRKSEIRLPGTIDSSNQARKYVKKAMKGVTQTESAQNPQQKILKREKNVYVLKQAEQNHNGKKTAKPIHQQTGKYTEAPGQYRGQKSKKKSFAYKKNSNPKKKR